MIQEVISGLYWSRFDEDAHIIILLIPLQDLYWGTTMILMVKVTQMYK